MNMPMDYLTDESAELLGLRSNMEQVERTLRTLAEQWPTPTGRNVT